MKKICIVGCGKKKVWDNEKSESSINAKDIYTGVFTHKCIQYAQKFYKNSYYILSAKYGFLFPDESVKGPYNECFHKKNSNPISTEELLKQINDYDLNNCEKIVVLGGKYYTELIKNLFPQKEVINPLEGCKGIGQMIKKLNELINNNA
ncbi:MAG: DUF6884 domain-containing protein [Methanobacterium sp.]